MRKMRFGAQHGACQTLGDALYREIVARLKQDDSTVPYRKNGYWYNTRFETGKEHPIFVRRKEASTHPRRSCWMPTS